MENKPNKYKPTWDTSNYKKQSNMKQIIFYGSICVLCLLMQLWLYAVIFAVLTAVFVLLHLRVKDKPDSNIIKQGLYQAKLNKKKEKAFLNWQEKKLSDALDEIDEKYSFIEEYEDDSEEEEDE